MCPALMLIFTLIVKLAGCLALGGLPLVLTALGSRQTRPCAVWRESSCPPPRQNQRRQMASDEVVGKAPWSGHAALLFLPQGATRAAPHGMTQSQCHQSLGSLLALGSWDRSPGAVLKMAPKFTLKTHTPRACVM